MIALASLVLAIGCAPKVHHLQPLAGPVQPTGGCATTGAGGTGAAIRSLDGSLQALLAEGCRRSPTFQRLASRIGRTDGVVYVQPGLCPFRGLKGCLLHLIHDRGNARYLWIRVNRNNDPGELVATIAHELQHALEVLERRWIRTRWDLLDFYHSFESGAFGSTQSGSPVRNYETAAAINAGAAVRSELAAPPAAVAAADDRH